MADCRKCKHNYKMPGDEPRCNRMCDGESDFEPITNAMRIRAMSDEELADYLYKMTLASLTVVEVDSREIAIPKLLKWLQSEAE